MSEFCRVFFNKKRIGLVIILALLCLILFYISLLEQIGPREGELFQKTQAYENQLIAKWKGKKYEEIEAEAKAEEQRLNEYSYFVSGYYYDEGFPYETIQEADLYMADVPYYVKIVRMRNGFTGSARHLLQRLKKCAQRPNMPTDIRPILKTYRHRQKPARKHPCSGKRAVSR